MPNKEVKSAEKAIREVESVIQSIEIKYSVLILPKKIINCAFYDYSD
jgi:hypothetical protein